jgi:O-antigen/teichoic acid export membrane protein
MTRSAHASIDSGETDHGDTTVRPTTSESKADRNLPWRTIILFGLKILGVALSFVMNIMLVRLIGVEGFGLFSFAVSVLMILEIIAIFGFESVLVREVAASRERREAERVRGLVLFCGGTVLLFSLTAVALTSGAVSFILPSSWAYADTLLIAVWALPASALLVAVMSVLEGHRRPFFGQVISMVFRPSFILVGILGLAQLGWVLTAETAAWVMVLAYTLGFVLLAGFLLYHMGGELWRGAVKVEAGSWMKMAAGFAFVNAAFVINEQTDVMMLAALSDPASVGIYRAAARYGQILSFALLAAMPVLRPMLSTAFTRGDRQALHKGCRQVALISLVVGLPIAAALVLFGDVFMGIFGPEFVKGSTALSILVAGQLLAIAAGPVGVLMAMTGHERKVAVAVGLSFICNVFLNFLLIPLFNLEGAALSTAISLAVWNVVMLVWVIRSMRINPTLIGRPIRN